MFNFLPSHQMIIALRCVEITKVRLPQLQEGRGCSVKCDPYFLEIRSVLKQAWAGVGDIHTSDFRKRQTENE
jgi:hypothetical protein